MSKKNKKQKLSNTGVLATNRKARHDYHILDTWECGLVLQGTEIKALELSGANGLQFRRNSTSGAIEVVAAKGIELNEALHAN